MEWDNRHGWHKPLRSFFLADGRPIYLMSLELEPTYLFLLEGTPYKRMNWWHLKYLRDQHKGSNSERTTTQILPSEIQKQSDERSMEEAFLPECELLLNFESDVMVEGEGAYSFMRVAYFCEREDMLNLDKIMRSIRSEIDWNKYAKDCWP